MVVEIPQRAVTRPKISIVTICLNQREFVAQAIESVLDQEFDNVEYVVVDAGSTDGSRAVIERYRSKLSGVVFESDEGPADGLNRGFGLATGEVYGFLNSDDILLPGALQAVAEAAVDGVWDVLSGHSVIIDRQTRYVRTSYSDQFSLRATAYGACVLMQPSTFFKAAIFRRAGGFNVENRATWDGELFADMALSGARFVVLPRLLSGFRVYPGTYTSRMASSALGRMVSLPMFSKIMGRSPTLADIAPYCYYRVRKYVLNPRALKERLLRGPIAGDGFFPRGKRSADLP